MVETAFESPNHAFLKFSNHLRPAHAKKGTQTFKKHRFKSATMILGAVFEKYSKNMIERTFMMLVKTSLC